MGAGGFTTAVKIGTTPWTVQEDGVIFHGIRFYGDGDGTAIKAFKRVDVEVCLFENLNTAVWMHYNDGNSRVILNRMMNVYQPAVLIESGHGKIIRIANNHGFIPKTFTFEIVP